MTAITAVTRRNQYTGKMVSNPDVTNQKQRRHICKIIFGKIDSDVYFAKYYFTNGFSLFFG
jgi:hypothetical protein